MSSGTITASEYIQHHLTHWSAASHAHAKTSFMYFNIDSLLVAWILGFGFLFLFRFAVVRANAGVPGKFQNAIEMIIEFVQGFVKEAGTGKSTFINTLTGQEVKDIGYDQHTQNIGFYKVAKEVMVISK